MKNIEIYLEKSIDIIEKDLEYIYPALIVPLYLYQPPFVQITESMVRFKKDIYLIAGPVTPISYSSSNQMTIFTEFQIRHLLPELFKNAPLFSK